ncbi:MAG TPA: S-adenosyl-l-methionine hydroxide adenosyltransferase family protein [Cyclobacteriaceae bacterium]
MAIITLLSDFGIQDHYVGAVKASILTINPSINIIDISHQINPYDISHAAYILGSVFRDFPKGTVHLISIGSTTPTNRFLATKLEDHYFLNADNGFTNLLKSDQTMTAVDINANNTTTTTFPAKAILAPYAAKIASGYNFHELGKEVFDQNILINPSVRLTKSSLKGQVIYIDHYGNLITNIEKKSFDKFLSLTEENDYEVKIGREVFPGINRFYNDVELGECFLLFNSNSILEIGINQGHAARLLGQKKGSPVVVTKK